MARVPPPNKGTTGKGVPPMPTATIGNLDKPESNRLSPLNFKVPVEFRREFKTYAAQNDMSLTRLLQESFRAFKEKRGG
jgi:hypothetical protein